jgi:hypothetical protein
MAERPAVRLIEIPRVLFISVARRRLTASMVPQDLPSGFDLIEDLVGSVAGGPRDMSARKKDYLKSTGYKSIACNHGFRL